jgi:hypothetical protein
MPLLLFVAAVLVRPHGPREAAMIALVVLALRMFRVLPHAARLALTFVYAVPLNATEIADSPAANG